MWGCIWLTALLRVRSVTRMEAEFSNENGWFSSEWAFRMLSRFHPRREPKMASKVVFMLSSVGECVACTLPLSGAVAARFSLYAFCSCEGCCVSASGGFLAHLLEGGVGGGF